MTDWIGSSLDLCVDGVSHTVVGASAGYHTCPSVLLCSLSILLWMMHQEKTLAWFALLHNGPHSVTSRLGGLLGAEGDGTTNFISQPTTRWDILCNECTNMFETPSGVPDHKITHWIDLIDKNAQPSKLQQYCMNSAELAEVHK